MRPLRRTGRIARLNRWYDGLREPERFFLFAGAVLMPAGALVAWFPPAAAAFIAAVGLPRIWWICRGWR